MSIKEAWILLDVPNMAYRNYFALQGRSSYKTPTIYGVMRDLVTLNRTLGSGKFAFCFDGADNIRKTIDPAYKANRSQDTTGRKEVREELKILREEILPDLGVPNILCHPQGEADDVMAFLCDSRKKGDRFVLVSTDTDLYQLLYDSFIQIWNHATKSMISEPKLLEDYKLTPEQWMEMKAICGCKTDGIAGIPRVGLITATDYLLDKLPHSSWAYKEIKDQEKLITHNKRLIQLPCPDLEKDASIKLTSHVFDFDQWDLVMNKWALETLCGKCPV